MLAKISIELEDRQDNDVCVLLIRNQEVFSHYDYDFEKNRSSQESNRHERRPTIQAPAAQTSDE